MDPNQTVASVKAKLSAATEHFEAELKKIRSGRANPSMLDNVSVEVYGQVMPLKAAAGVVAPEAQLLQITPFDPANLQSIADAIRNDKSLNLTPTDDGRVIRINLPPLTTEDRQQQAKIIHQKVEETMITARQIRHEARENLEAAEKSKTIGKDEESRLEKQIDELMSQQKVDVDKKAQEKEQEITNL